jgi:predicted O-methyltransferase YrrM
MTMTTLTTAPLSLLLERLFAEAEATTSPALDDVSEEEQMRLLQSKTDYRDLYGRLKDLWLPVSKETGTLLYMLARSSNAHTIVEYGTSFGISALHWRRHCVITAAAG